VGAELGGRDGAIAGAGLGAAAGVAINTIDHEEGQREHNPRSKYDRHDEDHYNDGKHSHSKHFCPPGQAKKGRC
jgi:hypothetical protein